MIDNMFFFILTLIVMIIYQRLGVEESVNVDDNEVELLEGSP